MVRSRTGDKLDFRQGDTLNPVLTTFGMPGRLQ